jgi:hypothetical protein
MAITISLNVTCRVRCFRVPLGARYSVHSSLKATTAQKSAAGTRAVVSPHAYVSPTYPYMQLLPVQCRHTSQALSKEVSRMPFTVISHGLHAQIPNHKSHFYKGHYISHILIKILPVLTTGHDSLKRKTADLFVTYHITY